MVVATRSSLACTKESRITKLPSSMRPVKIIASSGRRTTRRSPGPGARRRWVGRGIPVAGWRGPSFIAIVKLTRRRQGRRGTKTTWRIARWCIALGWIIARVRVITAGGRPSHSVVTIVISSRAHRGRPCRILSVFSIFPGRRDWPPKFPHRRWGWVIITRIPDWRVSSGTKFLAIWRKIPGWRRWIMSGRSLYAVDERCITWTMIRTTMWATPSEVLLVFMSSETR
jgi:hypothetical protein